jgi:hypothetical protein
VHHQVVCGWGVLIDVQHSRIQLHNVSGEIAGDFQDELIVSDWIYKEK